MWRVVLEFVWPRGGWSRAARYVKHRLHRLPDPPHRIARGIFVGVFTTFTPFYGLHFFIAAFLAMVMRGNVLAALLSTFFGNPLTYVPIGVASLSTGHFLLGTKMYGSHSSILQKFGYAWRDLWHNIQAIWTDEVAHWDDLAIFYDEVFFPYMIGGIIPGLISGIICYYISLPLISAYQNRRKGVIAAKLASLKKKKRADSRTE